MCTANSGLIVTFSRAGMGEFGEIT